MFEQIGQLLIQSVFGLVIYIALLRLWMHLARAPFRNPVGQAVMAFTDWAVLPLRRLLPPFRNFDIASLVLALVAQGLMLTLLFWISSAGRGWPSSWVGAFFMVALMDVMRAALHIVMFVVIVHVVMGWMNPYNPLSPAFDALTRPLYNVFRRFVPPIGNIDLSPLFVLLVVQIGLIVIDNLPRLLVGAG